MRRAMMIAFLALLLLFSGPPLDKGKGEHRPAIILPDSSPFASDAEGERDFFDYANGSLISSDYEILYGNLTWSSDPMTLDTIDWYKLRLPDVDPRAGSPNGVRDVRLNLLNYTNNTGDLYELEINKTNHQLEHDWADFLMVFAIYQDPVIGKHELGGNEWYYDDRDDTDGISYDENWTFSFRTPGPSFGTIDNNGFTDGLSETGFYYIGISFNFHISPEASVTRPDFTAHYELEVDATARVDNDQVSNDILNATSELPASGRIDTETNPVDWYRITGSNGSRVWRFDIHVNRTDCNLKSNPTTTQFWDNWVWVVLASRDKGSDGLWNTPDDGWTIEKHRISAVIAQVDSVHLVFPDLNFGGRSDRRGAYIGLYEEPKNGWVSGGQVAGFTLADWSAFSDYTIEVNIVEEIPTTPPVIMDVWVETDFPCNDYSFGGYYGTVFTLYVTYMDAEGHMPAWIRVQVDDGRPGYIVYIEGSPVDVFDVDVTDGKVYKYTFEGVRFTERPYPHAVQVSAKENLPAASVMPQLTSETYYFNEAFYIWDDDPIRINADWEGLPSIAEEENRILRLLDSTGPFIDPEGEDPVEVLIRGGGDDEWTHEMDLEMAHITIQELDGVKVLSIEPKEEQFGYLDFEVRVFDEHSYATRMLRQQIYPVNDLPIVHNISIGDRVFTAKRRSSDSYEADLRGLVDVMEDETLIFEVGVCDPDGEEIFIEWVPNMSSTWSSTPAISDGTVTIVPDNDDVLNDCQLMSFMITDGSGSEVELGILVEVQNVNDPPTITIPTITPTWSQFSRINIRPVCTDPDPGDRVVFSVNFNENFSYQYGSVREQLPYAGLRDGIDWDINPITGQFFFNLDDQDIWRGDMGFLDEIEITIVFMATDTCGANDTARITMVLRDVNQEPDSPVVIYYAPRYPGDGEPVHFWTEPVYDPDGDVLTYHWDFGDGVTGMGMHVNHTYGTKGFKTAQMWVEDGEFSSEKIAIRIEVMDIRDRWDEMDNDGDGVKNRYDAFPNDISASLDSDRDGYPDRWNAGYNHLDSTTGLKLDRFPEDPREWMDSDGDGHGDNGDEFPYDSSEWRDRDGDGIGDNADIFPRVHNGYLRTGAIIASVILFLVILVLLIVLRNMGRRAEYGEMEE
ncbi:MAG: PKD domain-containing protein [Thermoplasmatota archaeon]